MAKTRPDQATAIEIINGIYGKGFAAKNPTVIAEFVRTAIFADGEWWFGYSPLFEALERKRFGERSAERCVTKFSNGPDLFA